MKAKYIPNILSIIRLMLVGVFIYVFYNVGVIEALIIFIIAGVTDVIDGLLARKFNWITNVGKILDPIADKSMQCTVLLCMSLGDEPMIPWWLAAFFVVKEVSMAIGALLVFKKRDTVVSSRWFGKLAVCIFYATVFLIIVFDLPWPVIVTLSLITITASLSAFITYVRDYSRLPKNVKTDVSNSDESKITEKNNAK